MLNLHEIHPDIFPNEDIVIDLGMLYKNHYNNSHLIALEEIFKAGVICALKNMTTANVVDYDAETKYELDCLRVQFVELQRKYETLLSKTHVTQPTPLLPDHDGNHVALDQMMGMGKVLKV